MSSSSVSPIDQGLPKKQKNGLKQWLRLIFGLTIIAILAWTADLSQIINTLARIDPFWLIMAFIVELISILVWAVRWSILLEIYNIHTGFSKLVKAIFVGIFFSNFLPTNFGGDFYRGYWILADKQLYRKSLFIIFIERLIGVIFLGYIALPALLIFLMQGFELVDIRFLILPLGLLCCSILMLHPKVFSFMNQLFFGTDGRLLRGIRQKVQTALQALHEAKLKKWGVYLSSLAVQFTGILLYYCLGNALGIAMNAWHYLIIVPLVVLVTTLPLTFNGLGSREITLVLLATALGAAVTSAQMIALGLLWTFVVLVISIIGGGFYIAENRKEAVVA